ncbi:molybdenum cofactor biosysnthesis protein MoeA [Acinetobacter gyllenbergii]|nr:molybdenum cofactor biosysnthesis protein MoeA [Acinetobacter gyllenbergii]
MHKKLPVPENLPCRLTDAFYRIHQHLPKGHVKTLVELDDALNQVNASDVYALQDFPQHNFSAYAGWGIDSKLTQHTSPKNPVVVKGLYFWNQQLYRSINPYKLNLAGCLTKIPEYTKLPEGMDAIILAEDKRLDFSDIENVKVKAEISALHGVIQQGSVFKQGDLILEKNNRITPEKLIALRRAGIKTLSIYRHPKILIVNMHPFDKQDEVSEECLYIQDLLKTWGYHQVEIKSHKPARYDCAFENLKKENHPALDETLTSGWEEHHQFFDQQISEFDMILCWSPFNGYDSELKLSRLANFYQGIGESPLNTCSIPANEFRIFNSNDRSPKISQTVQIYDENGNHKGFRVEITEDRTSIISLAGDMQDVVMLMHMFVKYILNKHVPDFFDHLYLKGKINQPVQPDSKHRKLLWGRYQMEADGQYALQLIEQQPYQIDAFIAANCIIILPFAEHPIQSGEVLDFIKID